MNLRWIDSNGVSDRELGELSALRKRTDGFLWLDIPQWSDEAEAILANEFQFHQLAIVESKTRSHIPRVHVYPDHLFIVVHAPEISAGGHVHYLELDQFIGGGLPGHRAWPYQPQGLVGGGAAGDEGGSGPAGQRSPAPHLTIRPLVCDRVHTHTP